jgi:hypothetical protein
MLTRIKSIHSCEISNRFSLALITDIKATVLALIKIKLISVSSSKHWQEAACP